MAIEPKTGQIDSISKTDSISSNFFRIGKPCHFPNRIDKDHRIGKYIRTKMNIIELVPCTFGISLKRMGENKDGLSGFIPVIKYRDAIKEYEDQCEMYGLDKYSGIKIFTTDDTTMTDSFTNTRQPNDFQTNINSMSQQTATIRNLIASTGEVNLKDLRSFVDPGIDQLGSSLSGALSDGGLDANTSNVIGQTATGLSKLAADAVLSGHKVSLPSIWESSNYEPNLNVSFKLVSPYGHPDAIAEFIIKPVCYLLILSGAKTEDGVSYGRPFPVSISAYGMAYTPLGSIRQITFSRGGADSSFNIYRQPLSINVTMQFQYLNEGFAVFKNKEGETGNKDINTFQDATTLLTEFDPSINDESQTCIPTLGHIIRSLRPYDYTETNKSNNNDQEENPDDTKNDENSAQKNSADETTEEVVNSSDTELASSEQAYTEKVEANLEPKNNFSFSDNAQTTTNAGLDTKYRSNEKFSFSKYDSNPLA